MFDPLSLLWCLVLLQTKHFLADFCLQTNYMLSNKTPYLHPGGLQHAGVHGMLSLAALALSLPIGFGWTVLISVFDAVAHYHIDYTKQRVHEHLNPETSSKAFWIITGADQFLHQVTMIAMIALAGMFAGG